MDRENKIWEAFIKCNTATEKKNNQKVDVGRGYNLVHDYLDHPVCTSYVTNLNHGRTHPRDVMLPSTTQLRLYIFTQAWV